MTSPRTCPICGTLNYHHGVDCVKCRCTLEGVSGGTDIVLVGSAPAIEYSPPRITPAMVKSALDEFVEYGLPKLAEDESTLDGDLDSALRNVAEYLNNQLYATPPHPQWCAWCGKWGDHTSGGCKDLFEERKRIKTFGP